jgi:hypothetical protein
MVEKGVLSDRDQARSIQEQRYYDQILHHCFLLFLAAATSR